MDDVQILTTLIDKLSPPARQEVQDFVQFLLSKQRPCPPRKPTLDWKGALKDLRDQYTSVALQHEALKWWAADVSP